LKQAQQRILLVDDDGDSREAVRAFLEAEGYAVTEAGDGKHALDILTSGELPEPNLIVLDLEMPVMTGLELLTALEGHARLSAIPVLVVSGSHHEAEATAYAAVVGYLRKPCDLGVLLAHVRRVLVRHDARTVDRVNSG
jgi:CheY-like chemotaxis protein